MDESKKIEPHKVTKPIQLLAAWLVGLILIDASFLSAASYISRPEWVVGVLVCAAVFNVPLFLFAIFLLQTRFRPEMQEDSFYAKYLESKTGNTKREVTPEALENVREQIALLALEQEERFKFIIEEKKKTIESSNTPDAIKELEEVIADIETKLNKKSITEWAGKTISVNQNIDKFAEIVKSLASHGITVHETFGGGIKPPTSFCVSLGSGFTSEQIRRLVEAIAPIIDGKIVFAHDEEKMDEYMDKVLIGSYGESSGISFNKLLALLTSHDVSDVEVYKMLGR